MVSPKPLALIENKYTELFLIMHSTKLTKQFGFAEQNGHQS